MTYTPLPRGQQDSDPQLDRHPADHNLVDAAIARMQARIASGPLPTDFATEGDALRMSSATEGDYAWIKPREVSVGDTEPVQSVLTKDGPPSASSFGYGWAPQGSSGLDVGVVFAGVIHKSSSSDPSPNPTSGDGDNGDVWFVM